MKTYTHEEYIELRKNYVQEGYKEFTVYTDDRAHQMKDILVKPTCNKPNAYDFLTVVFSMDRDINAWTVRNYNKLAQAYIDKASSICLYKLDFEGRQTDFLNTMYEMFTRVKKCMGLNMEIEYQQIKEMTNKYLFNEFNDKLEPGVLSNFANYIFNAIAENVLYQPLVNMTCAKVRANVEELCTDDEATWIDYCMEIIDLKKETYDLLQYVGGYVYYNGILGRNVSNETMDITKYYKQAEEKLIETIISQIEAENDRLFWMHADDGYTTEYDFYYSLI